MAETSLACSEIEILASLEKIATSRVFMRARQQRRLLKYLVEQTLAGRSHLLKGYTIAVEVFQRPATFDSAVNAIVRVQAGQLRARLREYYAGEGSSDIVRMHVPQGSYAVHFTRREDEPMGVPTPTPTPIAAGLMLEPDTNRLFNNGGDLQAAQFTLATVAVLPFANMSSEVEQECFAAGITEDLTTELSKLSGLFVIARQSAFAYKQTAKEARTISRELGVRYLVEGSVRRAGKQLRISARLVDGMSGGTVWSERYDGDVTDVFAVQDDITRRIVKLLKVSLTPGETERLGYSGTRNIAAYEQLQYAREQLSLFTKDGNANARQYCRNALELDDCYAMACAELARTLAYDWAMDWTSDAGVLETALEYADKATEINHQLALAHAVMGHVQMWRKQGVAAIDAGERAVALDPNNAEARMFLCYSLAACNRAEEGLSQIETALRLHPYRSVHYMYALGLCHYLLYDYGRAIAVLEQALECNSRFAPHLRLLVKLYNLTGRPDDARRAREFVLKSDGHGPMRSTFYIDPGLDARAEKDRKLAWGA